MGNRRSLTQSEMEQVLEKAFYMHLGLSVNNEPYVVPVSFVYFQGAVYFHGSGKGKKMDMLRANPRVCFQVLVDPVLKMPVDSTDACKIGVRYRSVTGSGAAKIVEDHAEKTEALRALAAHYTDREFGMPEEKIRITTVIRIDVASMTGKIDGD